MLAQLLEDLLLLVLLLLGPDELCAPQPRKLCDLLLELVSDQPKLFLVLELSFFFELLLLLLRLQSVLSLDVNFPLLRECYCLLFD